MCQSPITAIITRPLITAKRFRTQHSEYYTLDIICLAPGADGPCPSKKKKMPKTCRNIGAIIFFLTGDRLHTVPTGNRFHTASGKENQN